MVVEIDLEEDAEQSSAPLLPKKEAMDKLHVLISEVTEAERLIEQLQERIKELKEKEIPEVFDAAGMTKIHMADGTSVEVKEEIYASISEERKEEAFAWLKENKEDAIIKPELKIKFVKGKLPTALRLKASLIKAGVPEASIVCKEDVHWKTLRSWVKDCLSEAVPIPLELFGVHQARFVTIKPGKK